MATFVDPVADAAEAYEGLRGLAHATRVFEDPADTHRVLGEVSGSVRLLRQVLDQLSRAHAVNRTGSGGGSGHLVSTRAWVPCWVA